MLSVRRNYEALRFRVLDHVEITDENWLVLTRAKQNPIDPSYLKAVPIIVATFRAAACEEIKAWGKAQNIIHDEFTPRTIYYGIRPPEVIKRYHQDLRAIHQTLFGNHGLDLEVYEAGIYKAARNPGLHTDSIIEGIRNINNFNAYVCRLFALPLLYIRRQNLDALSMEHLGQVDHLRKQAEKDYGIRGKKKATAEDRLLASVAKEELMKQGHLQPLPLGAVGLMHSSVEHASSDLSCDEFGQPLPVFSAFLYAKGKYKVSPV